MFFGITDLTTFVLGTIFIVLLPGPNSLYVMTVASRAGIGPGYRAALGIFAADIVLMTLSATGIASLLNTSPQLFLLLKLSGAVYLAFLGIGLLKAAKTRYARCAAELMQVTTRQTPYTPTRPFVTALGIGLLNPKAILFFVSFFVQFVSPDYPYPALSFLILGALTQVFSMIYLSALILGGREIARLVSSYPWIAVTSLGAVGLLFIGFALKLASASLP